VIEIIVIGTGMYTIGRNTDGFGTVVPSINEWSKGQDKNVLVHLVGSNGSNNNEIRSKINDFRKLTGSQLEFAIYPEDNHSNNEAYLDVLSSVVKPLGCVIAVPDNLHFSIAKEVISKKIATLVVKPLTPSYSESLELVCLSEKFETFGCVEFHKRYDLANKMFRDTYNKGDLGEPLYSIVEYSQRLSIPTKVFRGWVETTNIFQYLGVHYVDIIRYVTRAHPVRVSAIGQKVRLCQDGVDTYDSIQCVIEWQLPRESKTFSQTIHVNWVDPDTSPVMSNQRIKMIGSTGRYESDQSNRGVSFYSNEVGYSTPNPYFCTPYGTNEGHVEWNGYGVECFSTFFDDCVGLENGSISLNTLNNERASFQESLVSTLVVEACNISLSQNGRWVQVDEIIKG
jgi:predicted dehydrogenase